MDAQTRAVRSQLDEMIHLNRRKTELKGEALGELKKLRRMVRASNVGPYDYQWDEISHDMLHWRHSFDQLQRLPLLRGQAGDTSSIGLQLVADFTGAP